MSERFNSALDAGVEAVRKLKGYHGENSVEEDSAFFRAALAGIILPDPDDVFGEDHPERNSNYVRGRNDFVRSLCARAGIDPDAQFSDGSPTVDEHDISTTSPAFIAGMTAFRSVVKSDDMLQECVHVMGVKAFLAAYLI